MIQGKDIEIDEDLDLGDIEALQGVVSFRHASNVQHLLGRQWKRGVKEDSKFILYLGYKTNLR